MSTINIRNVMVTAKLTCVGKKAMRESGEDIICDRDGPYGTIRCSFGTLMEVFGNACFCHYEQNRLFVDNEITIEDQPGPVECPASEEPERKMFHRDESPIEMVTRWASVLENPTGNVTVDEQRKATVGLRTFLAMYGVSMVGPEATEPESIAPRFRITTNGEKFRVEELQTPNGKPGEAKLMEMWAHVGGIGHHLAVACGWKGYDTEPEAEQAMAERVRATERATRPWVPVKESPPCG